MFYGGLAYWELGGMVVGGRSDAGEKDSEVDCVLEA